MGASAMHATAVAISALNIYWLSLAANADLFLAGLATRKLTLLVSCPAVFSSTVDMRIFLCFLFSVHGLD